MYSFSKNITLRRLYYIYKQFTDRFSYMHGSGNSKTTSGAIMIHNKIQVKGSNNRIVVSPHALVKNTLIKVIGDNNTIYIRERAFVSGAELWIEDNGCTLDIGARTFVGPSHLAVTEDNSKLIIGENCLLSSHINVRTGDSHSIIDISEGNNQRINPAKDIMIGNHVWIGEGAKILKGVVLGEDVIVSTGAIVTSSFENNVLVGGVPAKVLKQSVSWDHKRF